MLATCAQETCTRNLLKKLECKIWRKFITVSCTKTILRPITLHGSCHVPHSFCDGIQLCSIACKKLVPEKNLYQIDRHTYKFLVPDDWYKFLVQVSRACVTRLTVLDIFGPTALVSWVSGYGYLSLDFTFSTANNLDLTYFYYFSCLSNAIRCMRQNINSLAACISVGACAPCMGFVGRMSQKRLKREARLQCGTILGNGTSVSRDQWRHMTLKVKVVVQVYFDANILNSVRDSIGQTPCSLNIILYLSLLVVIYSVEFVYCCVFWR